MVDDAMLIPVRLEPAFGLAFFGYRRQVNTDYVILR